MPRASSTRGMQDYEALADRSFDEPLTPDERAGLRVWADALEWAGDPRGPLISLEHLLRDQPRRRHQLHRAMNQHVKAHASHLLGGFAPFIDFQRAVVLEWRSGRLYGAFLDTRYLSRRAQIAPEQLVAELVHAPMAATLRRLHVRVRTEAQVAPVLRVMSMVPRGSRRLQELRVTHQTRPLAVASGQAGELTRVFPDLWLLFLGYYVQGLPLAIEAPSRALATIEPSSRDGRVVLGRALANYDGEIRAAALQRITALGPRAFMFVETLMLLLEPGVIRPQAPVAACLGALGDGARIALPLLATITGRVDRYDRDTRRAASAAIAALTE